MKERKEKENQLLKAQNETANANLQRNRIFLIAAVSGLLLLAILLYVIYKNKEAKACLLKSIKIYPQLPEANYYLAMIYKKEKNDAERKKYLELARAAKLAGYSISEDNIFYAYYPHQITLYEINQELK